MVNSFLFIYVLINAGDVPPCRSSCINDTQPYTKYYSELSTLRWHIEVSGMQAALFQNGPMVACFSCYEGLFIKFHPHKADFLTYTSGVYVYTEGEYLGGHCIKFIGWGHDSQSGLDYWLAQVHVLGFIEANKWLELLGNFMGNER